jgi:hypothetical protein
LGNAPPRKNALLASELKVEIPSAALPPTIMASGKAESYLRIVSVEWYAEGIQFPIDLHVFQPSCSLNTGGVYTYNPQTGYCEENQAREVGLNRGFGTELTCEALTFNNLFSDCFASTCSAINSNCLATPGKFKEPQFIHNTMLCIICKKS